MRDKQPEEKVITFFMKGNNTIAGQRLRPGRNVKKRKTPMEKQQTPVCPPLVPLATPLPSEQPQDLLPHHFSLQTGAP